MHFLMTRYESNNDESQLSLAVDIICWNDVDQNSIYSDPSLY